MPLEFAKGVLTWRLRRELKARKAGTHSTAPRTMAEETEEDLNHRLFLRFRRLHLNRSGALASAAEETTMHPWPSSLNRALTSS